MEIKNLELPSLNQFASDYLQGNLKANDYFHYDLSNSALFQERYDELMSRSFLRAELADYIYRFMSKFNVGEKVLKNIDDFRQEESVVVIGGQQAGLMSGPLYTIHKVISIIKLAAEQEKILGKRVIPVFWIAGEDHDLAEVNHVYVMKNGKPEKKTYPLYHPFKSMITDMELDVESAMKWIEEIIETYGETEYTKTVIERSKLLLEQGRTFVDFFAALMNDWFSDYGLLLLDAGDPELRNIESRYFTMLIEQTGKITDSVLSQQAFIKDQGYNRAIEMEENAANLFYYDPEKKERILLEIELSGSVYRGKNSKITFSHSELLDMAAHSPERLSNNVVTRPIMQEMLFPVLAFISGPGEIAYWAELKKAFEVFDMKMPPIIPRLNITILERGIATDIQETGISLHTALTEGTQNAEHNFIESVKDDSIEKIYDLTRSTLEENHRTFSLKSAGIDKGLEPMFEKNRQILLEQLDFMYSRVMRSTKEKHSVVLDKYKRIETSLYPIGSPQERIWNVFYYLNKYGLDFIEDLMALEYEFNNQHKVVCL
jgi:bacillithiol synthase